MLFDIPVYGTMAHAYVQAHETERTAFESFARAQSGNVVLLIDTYDTANGARIVVDLAPRLQQSGIAIKAVRLDSGDPRAEAEKVRRILDEGGLQDVGIFCSGNLDEIRVRDLVRVDAPITGFGIGTKLDTSDDAPSLESVYKLVAYDGKPRRKHSEGKATWPGRKQVFREYTTDGRMRADTITLEGKMQPGQPLLETVLRGGTPIRPYESLSRIRERCAQQLAQLCEPLRTLGTEPTYEVLIAPELTALAEQTDEAIFSRKNSLE
jgi:nicotinate phosphoribosyltransferase